VAAAAFAKHLAIEPDLIVTSGYMRSEQTAEPLAERFPKAARMTFPLQEFTFLAPARCADSTFSQRRPWVEEYWTRCDPSFIDGLGAESFSSFSTRVRQSVHRIEELPFRRVIVVAHAHVIRLVQTVVLKGSFDAVTMEAYRACVACRPVENLEMRHTSIQHGYFRMLAAGERGANAAGAAGQ
jgi:broad specificity phosphatase PhoE